MYTPTRSFDKDLRVGIGAHNINKLSLRYNVKVRRVRTLIFRAIRRRKVKDNLGNIPTRVQRRVNVRRVRQTASRAGAKNVDAVFRAAFGRGLFTRARTRCQATDASAIVSRTITVSFFRAIRTNNGHTRAQGSRAINFRDLAMVKNGYNVSTGINGDARRKSCITGTVVRGGHYNRDLSWPILFLHLFSVQSTTAAPALNIINRGLRNLIVVRINQLRRFGALNFRLVRQSSTRRGVLRGSQDKQGRRQQDGNLTGLPLRSRKRFRLIHAVSHRGRRRTKGRNNRVFNNHLQDIPVGVLRRYRHALVNASTYDKSIQGLTRYNRGVHQDSANGSWHRLNFIAGGTDRLVVRSNQKVRRVNRNFISNVHREAESVVYNLYVDTIVGQLNVHHEVNLVIIPHVHIILRFLLRSNRYDLRLLIKRVHVIQVRVLVIKRRETPLILNAPSAQKSVSATGQDTQTGTLGSTSTA